ncbi:phosphatidylglycerophosphatase A [Candidatus Kinetoplastibacterium blastocrithidii TCC012E]|uniref:Phosphatidylglycerophosphatase A n=1 Tax=Candidatus Kinetoplastidibacterium blastocrithidiae TCC012E TaxID=1208922 RepID=M1LVX4_9PROT|nr:phosphatidylglycerophosphatase A [Candidatus Kinetoplastibacterium blastocrithidii]AFZ83589.1 phosphatidylglycerophosphatase [Candidatus Kinetoplastibacterium blastocrithidii (ex Strigomonas culicis)]AGF49707.1 phosphatidylglycerophosphatase A [Candidatus Kinetoplastibacterium blastocrithidii TCC012E]
MKNRYSVGFPNFSWICKKHERLVSFGFGSGLIRPGSGTWGTVLAWLLWHIIPWYLISNPVIFFIVSLGFVYGCIACKKVDDELGAHDHVGIVWDEIISFIIVLLFIPNVFYIQFVSFIIFRFFDTIKPYPINKIDKEVSSGIGIMLDDLIAAFYTIILVSLIFGL